MNIYNSCKGKKKVLWVGRSTRLPAKRRDG